MRYDIYRNDFQIDGDILTENLYFLCYTYIGDGMKRYIKTKKELKLYRVMRNWVIALSVLCAAWFICSVLKQINTSDVYVPMIFVLAVLIISLLTDGYFYGVLASVVSVIGVNWAFTYPYRKLDFSIYGYPTTFITMLAVSIVISTLTTRVREQDKLRRETEQAELRANLLRAISHDLRTPLTSVIGSISTVIDGEGSLGTEQRLALLRDAKKDAEWLVRMVENLLSITRISGSEAANITRSPELMEEIIGECVTNFRKRCPDICLNVRIPDDPVCVNVDAMLIEQVIMNLLDNAVHHAEGMTELNIDVSVRRKNAVVEVSDNGKGLDPSILNDIFKGQLSGGNGQLVDGNKFRGIGLAVCRTIVNAHGGRISADNLPRGGAIFRFTLPLEDEENEHQG